MERFPTVVLVAGFGFFFLSVAVMAVLPIKHLSRIEYQTLEEVAPEPSLEFIDLSERYPDQFKKYYGEPTKEAYWDALRVGRDQYIAEGCWHCHSQYVRPISNEDKRFGAVSWSGEYMNEMFLPHLFGTRRVGPDLIRQHGVHGNDWHAAHFYNPGMVVPTSVMPRYTWFFDGEKPNKVGIGVITYVQWLGSWATPEAIDHRINEGKASAR